MIIQKNTAVAPLEEATNRPMSAKGSCEIAIRSGFLRMVTYGSDALAFDRSMLMSRLVLMIHHRAS